MNHGHGDSPYCYFHPRELVVGVCAACLKERLLVLLASKQGQGDLRLPNQDHARYAPSHGRRKASLTLPKVFALGSFLQRLDSRHHRPDDGGGLDNKSDGNASSVASLDDSFISIKFEDNGKAMWDKDKAPAKADKVVAAGRPSGVVVEHVNVKRGGVTRWRKQVVGRLLQLARWRRPGKAGGAAACHVGLDGRKAAERSKGRGRGSWIRSLTARRRPTSSSAGAARGESIW